MVMYKEYTVHITSISCRKWHHRICHTHTSSDIEDPHHRRWRCRRSRVALGWFWRRVRSVTLPSLSERRCRSLGPACVKRSPRFLSGTTRRIWAQSMSFSGWTHPVDRKWGWISERLNVKIYEMNAILPYCNPDCTSSSIWTQQASPSLATLSMASRDNPYQLPPYCIVCTKLP